MKHFFLLTVCLFGLQIGTLQADEENRVYDLNVLKPSDTFDFDLPQLGIGFHVPRGMGFTVPMREGKNVSLEPHGNQVVYCWDEDAMQNGKTSYFMFTMGDDSKTPLTMTVRQNFDEEIEALSFAKQEDFFKKNNLDSNGELLTPIETKFGKLISWKIEGIESIDGKRIEVEHICYRFYKANSIITLQYRLMDDTDREYSFQQIIKSLEEKDLRAELEKYKRRVYFDYFDPPKSKEHIEEIKRKASDAYFEKEDVLEDTTTILYRKPEVGFRVPSGWKYTLLGDDIIKKKKNEIEIINGLGDFLFNSANTSIFQKGEDVMSVRVYNRDVQNHELLQFFEAQEFSARRSVWAEIDLNLKDKSNGHAWRKIPMTVYYWGSDQIGTLAILFKHDEYTFGVIVEKYTSEKAEFVDELIRSLKFRYTSYIPSKSISELVQLLPPLKPEPEVRRLPRSEYNPNQLLQVNLFRLNLTFSLPNQAPDYYYVHDYKHLHLPDDGIIGTVDLEDDESFELWSTDNTVRFSIQRITEDDPKDLAGRIFLQENAFLRSKLTDVVKKEVLVVNDIEWMLVYVVSKECQGQCNSIYAETYQGDYKIVFLFMDQENFDQPEKLLLYLNTFNMQSN